MEKVKYFMSGVFWSLFVGMALWIAFDVNEKTVKGNDNLTVAERTASIDAIALKVEDLNQ